MSIKHQYSKLRDCHFKVISRFNRFNNFRIHITNNPNTLNQINIFLVFEVNINNTQSGQSPSQDAPTHSCRLLLTFIYIITLQVWILYILIILIRTMKTHVDKASDLYCHHIHPLQPAKSKTLLKTF